MDIEYLVINLALAMKSSKQEERNKLPTDRLKSCIENIRNCFFKFLTLIKIERENMLSL